MAEATTATGGDHRLWIGNLDPRITEYQLLQILKRYGDVKEFDFLFHKSGPNVGKPRGYSFVNYSTKEEAEKAMKNLDGKLALSKKLSVCWAQPHNKNRADYGKSSKQKFPVCMGGPSVGTSQRQMSTETKIRAIEAKLNSMEKNDDEFTVFPDSGMKALMQSRTKPQGKYNNNRTDYSKGRRKPYDRKRY
ncbi:putative RNA-binding protein 18 [Saccoglossus kowalevskii]|uniref:Probable RNA-binding protein 18 n=1 Tax=Saccoglossus kowalevskii TaxID=10224 RepID=A0ABM0MVA6_SACKO|nr:PREDICTED: probable RNA-binding protein 18-like [Saccoglossus kowalevskii]